MYQRTSPMVASNKHRVCSEEYFLQDILFISHIWQFKYSLLWKLHVVSHS